MTREEATEHMELMLHEWELTGYESDRTVEALEVLIDALRPTPDPITGLVPCGCGWVKTSDRLPTEADANKDLCVLAKVAKDGAVKEVRFEDLSWIEWCGAYYFSHWMKLPEVEG